MSNIIYGLLVLAIRQLISVVTKEIKILLTVRYHIIPIQAIKQINQIIPSTDEDRGRQAFFYTVGV